MVLAVSGLPSVALTVLRIVCCRVAGPAKCAQMMKMGDTDGDGLLSLEEFLQLGAIHVARIALAAGRAGWVPHLVSRASCPLSREAQDGGLETPQSDSTAASPQARGTHATAADISVAMPHSSRLSHLLAGPGAS